MTYAGRMEALFKVPTGGAAVSASNAGGGPSTCTVAAGSYYWTAAGGVSSLITAFAAALNAGRPAGWTVVLESDGSVTIDCSSEPWALTFTSTALRDALGFTGNIASTTAAQTGTKQARGLWYPECPLSIGGHPKMAPEHTDQLTLVSPTGDVVGLVGNAMLRHTRLVYSHVSEVRYREIATDLQNASWEQFVKDTQHGRGHAWFTPASKVQIYYLSEGADALVGKDYNSEAGVSGWYFAMPAVAAPLSSPPWTGYFRIEIPEITTSG